MLSTELVEKYIAYCEKHKLQAINLRGIVVALVESDYLHGTNEKTIDIDSFMASDDEAWVKYRNYLGVDFKSTNCEGLPDVQKLRLMCDSLYLFLKYLSLDDFDSASIHLTSEASTKVASLMGINLQSDGYSDEAECMRVLDSLLVPTNNYDVLEKVIKHHLHNQNRIFGFNECNLPIEKLILPEEVKVLFKEPAHVRFIPNKDYELTDSSVVSVTDFVVKRSQLDIISHLLKIYNKNRTAFCGILNSWLSSNQPIHLSVPSCFQYDALSKSFLSNVFIGGDSYADEEKSLYNFIRFVIRMGGRLNVE